MIDYKKADVNIFSDTKRLIQLIISLKYVYLACLVVFLAVAVFINKYFPKQYEVNASIIAVQNKKSSILSSSNNFFSGLDAISQNNDIENEISNLKSFARISSTISKMNLETGYFMEKDKLFKEKTELYKKSPFTVTVDRSHIQPIGNKFYIEFITDSTFHLKSESKNVVLYNFLDNENIGIIPIYVDTICTFNTTIENPLYKFSIAFNKDYESFIREQGSVFYFEFYHLDQLTKIYYKRLGVVRASNMSSILNITFSGENLDKVINFMSTYLNTYFEESLNKKNKIAVSTINFIDDQLSDISDSLAASESVLRNFRSTHQITNLGFQGQQLSETLHNIQEERSNLQVQERYYKYIIDYLNQNRDISGVSIPSSSANDNILTPMITDLLLLNTKRSDILNNKNTQSLFLKQLESRIENQKRLIIETATNNLNTLSLSLNELNYRSEQLSKQISNLPKTELNMVSMQRNYNINDAIYTYLLQKRSEAAIAKASNYPDFEILEPARAITASQTAPKTFINYVVAFILALFCPTAYLLIREFLNETIQTKSYIEKLIEKPVYGVIPTHEYESESVIIDHPQSAIAESFRNIRGSLFYKMRTSNEKIILITSSQPQDGKSFFSFNISHSIASVGVKTIIIDCDLHRPTLHKKFKVPNENGLSNYMSRQATTKEIIHPTDTENLYFIPAGPLMPNPSELLESGILDDCIEELKKEFDYILIDTTPFGIVADALAVMKYADEIIVVCRKDNTIKETLANVLMNLESHGFNDYEIVFNGIEFKQGSYGHYITYYKK